MGPEQKNILLKQCLDEYYDQILNFMYLRVQNRPDAEDLTQEVFLSITKNIGQFQNNSSIRTWIFAIARNILNSEYRQKSKFRRLFEKLHMHHVFQPKEQLYQSNVEIFMMLETLSESDRELIILKHYFGFSYTEIADITTLSVSNVGARLSRAISSLKDLDDERSEAYE
jgi:RNA polymerase sigma-70 factor, ECF subfamily